VNNRRKLIVALGAGALALPYCSFAQQQGKVWRVGVLGAGSPSGWAPMVEALRAGLRELGYIEASNINIDYRWADGQYDRLPELVADLIRLKVDVIVTHATAGIVAAKQATTSIPIIMASIGDPVAAGLLTNLSRPGGNITGLSFFTSEIGIKRLELLKEAVPDIKQVGVVWDRSLPRYFMAPMEAAARVIKVAVEFIDVDSADMLESTFAALAKKHVRGVVIRETPDAYIQRQISRCNCVKIPHRRGWIQGSRRRRWTYWIRRRHSCHVAPRSNVCRQNTQRCKAWRTAGRTGDEI
jgi:putative ABC transport system substrate-binding protein